MIYLPSVTIQTRYLFRYYNLELAVRNRTSHMWVALRVQWHSKTYAMGGYAIRRAP